MAIILNEEDGFWIQSPFGGDDIEFKLRDLDPVKEGQFRKQATSYKFIKKSDGSEICKEIIDNELLAWLRFNYMVTDWKGDIKAPDGKPAPCDEKHKRMLFTQKGLGVQTLLLKYAKVKAEEFKRERELLKNSDASSSSESIIQPLVAGSVESCN